MGVVSVLTTCYARGGDQEEEDEEDGDWEYEAWNALPEDLANVYVPPPLPHFGTPDSEEVNGPQEPPNVASAGAGTGASGLVNPLEQLDHNGDSAASILASFVAAKQRGVAETDVVLGEIQASVGKSMGQAAGWQGLTQESVATLRKHGNQCERMTLSQFEERHAQHRKGALVDSWCELYEVARAATDGL